MKPLSRFLLLALLAAPGARADLGPDPRLEGMAEVDVLQLIDQYQARVAELEAEGGMMSPRLGEELTGLGLAHRAVGNEAEAVEAFRRALHIERVNSGLHRMEHLPLLEEIMESHKALGNWEELDKDYEHYLWLHRRNYEDNDPRLAEAIKRVVDFRLAAMAVDALPLSYATVRRLDRLNDEAIDILKAGGPEERDALVDAYFRKAGILRHIAEQQWFFTDQTGAGYTAARDWVLARLPPMEREEMMRRQREAEFAYLHARRALLEAGAVTEPDKAEDPYAHARTLAVLGDWYLAFERNSAARSRYNAAWEVLAENNASQEEIDRIFGTPHLVRPFYPPTEDNPYREIGPWIDALADIRIDGRPWDVRVQDSAMPDDEHFAPRTRNQMRDALYRPFYEDGRPIVARDVPVRFYAEQ